MSDALTPIDAISSHKNMGAILLLAETAATAKSRPSILITGETGTGKEFVASAIHAQSVRAAKPFIEYNCAVGPEGLVESDLFGHLKGAFTGAVKDKKGRIEEAHGGTLFLDELGAMPLAAQVKLLRFLQTQEIIPVGQSQSVKVDVWVMAATNTDLPKAMEAGRFREDLYHRLNVIEIGLPPLRQRQEEIITLAENFLIRWARKEEKMIRGFSPEAQDLLKHYSWPGNIRELGNVVQHAVLVAKGDLINCEHFPERLRTRERRPDNIRDFQQNVQPASTQERAPLITPRDFMAAYVETCRARGETLKPADEFTLAYLQVIDQQTDHRQYLTAKLAGIGRGTVRKMLGASSHNRRPSNSLLAP